MCLPRYPGSFNTYLFSFFQHAGVAITITSLTDIVAFAIGGTTILPALRFFCLYASIGIAAIYVFQCTFFLACLCLDQVYLISILFFVFYHQGSFKFFLEIRLALELLIVDLNVSWFIYICKEIKERQG